MFLFRCFDRDAFLVLACDGIWDVMTSQDVVDFMGRSLGYTGKMFVLCRPTEYRLIGTIFTQPMEDPLEVYLRTGQLQRVMRYYRSA